MKRGALDMRHLEAIFSAVAVATMLVSSSTFAQDGDRSEGLALARRICSQCHTVDRSQAPSPNPASPRFETIAKVPGMTAAALSVALLTPHRTMPNVMFTPEQLPTTSPTS